ncbi:DUF4328 domain-containing protein [Alteraurantiacibacter aquimixticola]|uniref:DUF4328 domain-containing protein n=1 Tax=Alteraurantiacibacter aquimixticola TaxID=2489173 RepID=A0A4V4U8W6_9SPHN|nr:DUF4328 domain-containing protein [Alteraurantiacibacter aquimixticola]TIX51607.1 DUF4328 domain-containing protein [Alteraurantiacibacter aquimixticola]
MTQEGYSISAGPIGVLGRVARLALGAFMVAIAPVTLLYVVFFYLQLGSVIPGLPAEYAYLSLYQPLLLLIAYALFLLAVIPISIWIYRAHANLHEAGVDELNYRPVWAVASFFVPLVNFVVPFRSMRELHNRSEGRESWFADSSVDDVSIWWTCHVTAVLILAFTTSTLLINALPGIWLTTPPAADTALNVAGHFLLGCSAWKLFGIIGTITQYQSAGVGTARTFD